MEGYHPSVKQFPTMSWCFYCFGIFFWPGCSSFRRQHLHLGRQPTSCLLMWVNGMYETEPTWIKISMETSLVMLGRSHTQLGMKSHDWLAGVHVRPTMPMEICKGYIYIYSWCLMDFSYLVNWLLHFKLSLYTKQNHRAAKKKMNKN